MLRAPTDDQLEHVDPHWQGAAAWELARDCCAKREFWAIEETLLHHPSVEVVIAALEELCLADDAVISTQTDSSSRQLPCGFG